TQVRGDDRLAVVELDLDIEVAVELEQPAGGLRRARSQAGPDAVEGLHPGLGDLPARAGRGADGDRRDPAVRAQGEDVAVDLLGPSAARQPAGRVGDQHGVAGLVLRRRRVRRGWRGLAGYG